MPGKQDGILCFMQTILIANSDNETIECGQCRLSAKAVTAVCCNHRLQAECMESGHEHKRSSKINKIGRAHV